jgi:hypothetical protein
MGMRAAMLKACDPTLRPTRLQGTHTLPLALALALALALTQQQQAFLPLQLRLEATVGTGMPLLPPPPLRHPTTLVQ